MDEILNIRHEIIVCEASNFKSNNLIVTKIINRGML